MAEYKVMSMSCDVGVRRWPDEAGNEMCLVFSPAQSRKATEEAARERRGADGRREAEPSVVRGLDSRTKLAP